jgi:hypothetical protein
MPDLLRGLRYDSAVRGSLALCLLLAGCERDPVTAICPKIGEGDLVVTEIRGPQSPDDSNGPWVELFDPTAGSIDLEGTRIRFRKKDGSSEVDILVRDSVVIDSGGYSVLGIFSDLSPPAFADYNFSGDFRETWLASAAVDVETCGTLVDRATYDSLPDTGTFSFGTTPPSADLNDDLGMWCTDPSSAGTPGAANITCP